MVKKIKVWGTDDFRDLAAKLKDAGEDGKGLRKELAKGLRVGAQPIVDAAQSNVRSLSIVGTPLGEGGRARGGRGGRSARAARAQARLGKRKAGDRARMRAHRDAGLRDTVARTVTSSVTVSPRGAALRVRSNPRRMPRDQQRLPALMNGGRVRKPLFGNREYWTTNTMRRGWFDRAGKTKGPPAQVQAVTTVRTYLDKLI